MLTPTVLTLMTKTALWKAKKLRKTADELTTIQKVCETVFGEKAKLAPLNCKPEVRAQHDREVARLGRLADEAARDALKATIAAEVAEEKALVRMDRKGLWWPYLVGVVEQLVITFLLMIGVPEVHIGALKAAAEVRTAITSQQ